MAQVPADDIRRRCNIAQVQVDIRKKMSDTLEVKLWAAVYNTFCLLGNEFTLFERTSCALLLGHLTSPATYYKLSQKDFFPLTLRILSIFLWNYLCSLHVLHYLHAHTQKHIHVNTYIKIYV